MTIELPVAVLCAYIILNEQVNPLQIVGIIIMLVAIGSMIFFKYKLLNHLKPNNYKH